MNKENNITKPKILVVGESGSGKNTIQDYLTNLYGYKPLLSYTTRPKRFLKEDTHTFIDEDEYYRCKAEGNIIAYTYYNGNHYFATEQQLKESDVYIIDIDGIKYLKEYSDIPFIVFYIKVPKLKRIERMKQRGDSEQQIKERIAFDEKAFDAEKDLCDYVFENDNSLYTAAKINNIIQNLDSKIKPYKCDINEHEIIDTEREIIDKIYQIQTLILKLKPDIDNISIDIFDITQYQNKISNNIYIKGFTRNNPCNWLEFQSVEFNRQQAYLHNVAGYENISDIRIK